MKCPYCERKMQLGYIQCRDGVYWCKKKRMIAAFEIGGEKTIKIHKESVMRPFSGGSAEAWLCENCKKIVIEY